MDVTIVYMVIIAILIVCSAFFSMTETAFTSASQFRLKRMALDGNKKAQRAINILEDYDKFLTTVLVGNNLVNIGSTSLATLVFSAMLGAETGAMASTIFMTVSVLILGEITPKTIAKKYPEKCCIKVCNIIHVLIIVFSPVSWLFKKVTNVIAKESDEPTMTEDELEVMIDEIQDDGVIEKKEGDLIKSAIRFDDITAAEVYVPRVDLVAIDVNHTIHDLGVKLADSGFSRIPVYDGTIDNIIGVVYAKEFFSNRFRGEDFTIRDIVKPVKYVPETMSIATILSDFQKSKVHMAVILDSFGGTLGILTMEDILEELVGDIWDESDEIQQDVIPIDDLRFTVKGTANIYNVMEGIGREFDTREYEDYSVTGFICHLLGRPPVRGDKIELDGMNITVHSVKGRRVIESEFDLTEIPIQDDSETVSSG